MSDATRIPEDMLAEQWYSFMHELLAKLQAAFRAQKSDKLTQKIIAKRLGKKESFISRCLRGQENMTVRTVYYLARAMGYRLEIKLQPIAKVRPANRAPNRVFPDATTTTSGRVLKQDDEPSSASSGAVVYAH